MGDLGEWASRLLFPDRGKADFDKFMEEVAYLGTIVLQFLKYYPGACRLAMKLQST